ncbi:Hypothetical predicted protein, partial [Olea europaea subsp. europaea]
GISNNAIQLRLFPHTLHDKAIEWLDTQPIASITTWNDLEQKFCTKFFPPAKIAKLKHYISIFRQDDSKNLIKPGIGLKTCCKNVHITGLTKDSRSSISTRDYFNPSKAWLTHHLMGHGPQNLFETMGTTSGIWISEQAVQKKTPRVYKVDAYSTISAKIDSLFHKVENMSPSVHPPTLELKQLPPHLRYAYLEESYILSVIISNTVSEVKEEKLIRHGQIGLFDGVCLKKKCLKFWNTGHFGALRTAAKVLNMFDSCRLSVIHIGHAESKHRPKKSQCIENKSRGLNSYFGGWNECITRILGMPWGFLIGAELTIVQSRISLVNKIQK